MIQWEHIINSADCSFYSAKSYMLIQSRYKWVSVAGLVELVPNDRYAWVNCWNVSGCLAKGYNVKLLNRFTPSYYFELNRFYSCFRRPLVPLTWLYMLCLYVTLWPPSKNMLWVRCSIKFVALKLQCVMVIHTRKMIFVKFLFSI